MNTLRKLLENSNICTEILENELLSQHTTFKIGGKADVFMFPKTKEELFSIYSVLHRNGVPCFILGGGSNVVVSDSGIEGAVLCTRKICTIRAEETPAGIELHCGCGALMNDITTFCAKNGLTGLETFAGLPGTAGGALFMNARCYNTSISDVLVSAWYFDTAEETQKQYHFCASDWDYKKSPFQMPETPPKCAQMSAQQQEEMQRKIITEAVFRVHHGDKDAIAEKNTFYMQDRIQKGHFRFPSAGSVFKNNRTFGSPSGKIIDEAGLKGFAVGGAQVAPWHGNFIINTGNATAQDVQRLVQHIAETVKEQQNLQLEPEIIFTGKDFNVDNIKR